MNELIKFYFEKLKIPKLFGDPSITFAKNAEFLLPHSKDLIKSLINNKDPKNIIVVDDLEDKIEKF